jgi:hypothetical protein
MRNYANGIYQVQNTQKYVGKRPPRYRSGWELTFMKFCDNNDHILQWASEAIQIPYRNPLTGKNTHYIPDFLITYMNKNGKVLAELIEIKPKKQSVMSEGRMSPKERATVAINYAKWDQATKWARSNGMLFRVVTEDDIFHNGRA